MRRRADQACLREVHSGSTAGRAPAVAVGTGLIPDGYPFRCMICLAMVWSCMFDVPS